MAGEQLSATTVHQGRHHHHELLQPVFHGELVGEDEEGEVKEVD